MPANLPEKDGKPRIVIIGGGFAGINLANGLKKSKADVVMLDKENFHTFQPLLYQVATSGLETSSIAYPLRKVHGKDNTFFFRMAELNKVIPEENCIETSIGQIKYDYLVLATGMQNNFFHMKDVEEYSFPLKTLSEAVGMRNYLLESFERLLLTDDPKKKEGLLNYVIAGGGPTGVELAGALSELRRKVLPKDYPEIDFSKMRIIIIDPSPRVLAAMSEHASEKARQYLEDFGVEIKFGVGIKAFNGSIATLTNGETIPTETLIWAAGVSGSLPEGFSKEIIQRGNRLKVDEFCRVQGFNNIYAIGDIAYISTQKYPNGLPGLASVAIQEGSYLAKNFRRILDGKEAQPFKYFDKGALATIGRNKAVADLPGFKFAGFFAWVTWLVVHLFFLIGFRNKIVVLIDWFWNYISFDRRVRLIIKPFLRKVPLNKVANSDTGEKPLV